MSPTKTEPDGARLNINQRRIPALPRDFSLDRGDQEQNAWMIGQDTTTPRLEGSR